MQSDNRLLIALIVMVGLLSVIAIITSAIGLGRGTAGAAPNVNVFSSDYTRNAAMQPAGAPSPSIINMGSQMGGGGRVFTIAIGHDNGAHEYFDTRGYLQGFGLELINAVCDSIHIDCRIIWDRYDRCWKSEPGERSFGGIGLMGGWYDACAGWSPTVERLHVYSFGEPYLKPEKSYFFTQKGGFLNPSDVSGKKIGFIDGWASDEKCLARQTDVTGRIKAPNQVIYAKSAEELVSWMIGGQVDCAFATYSAMSKYVDDQKVSLVNAKSFTCQIGGAAIMTRKDSDFLSYWNAGFNKIRGNGKLTELCGKAEKDHRLYGELFCVDTY